MALGAIRNVRDEEVKQTRSTAETREKRIALALVQSRVLASDLQVQLPQSTRVWQNRLRIAHERVYLPDRMHLIFLTTSRIYHA